MGTEAEKPLQVAQLSKEERRARKLAKAEERAPSDRPAGARDLSGREARADAERLSKELKTAAKEIKTAIKDLKPEIRDVRKQLALLWRTIGVDLDDRYAERFADLAAPNPYRSVHDDSREQLLSLLRQVGVGARTFLDIGSGRSGGQSLFLARRLGWGGIFVDASRRSVESLRVRLGYLPHVQVRELIVTPENVNELAAELDEIDLLNIDIDSYEYWVWKSLRARPRLVVIEYSSHFGLEPVVVPFGAIAEDAPNGYAGASLAALEKLGREKGYLLLGCDRMGVNAYFGRADLLPADAGLTAEQAWRPIMNRLVLDDLPRASESLEAIEQRGLPLEYV